MRSTILYVPDNRLIDLSALTADTLTFLEGVGQCSRVDATLVCGKCQGALYLRRVAGVLYGVHHRVGECASLRLGVSAPMSDEHKNLVEYHVRAADAAGFAVETEVSTSAQTRVDVVVTGAVTAGFEIQRSQISRSAAYGRTKRSMSAGMIVSWCHDRERLPDWYGHLPSYAPTLRVWGQLPKPNSVGVTGLRCIDAVRCKPGDFDKCPAGKRRFCGEYHAANRPLLGSRLDEIPTRMAAGDLVPARLGRHVRIIRTQDVALYESLTGVSCRWHPAKPSMDQPAPGDRVACERPASCCKGGGLRLWCQVCPSSPTYWRSCHVCGRAVDRDSAGNLPTTHPECTSAGIE